MANGGAKEKVSIRNTIKFQGKIEFAWFKKETEKLDQLELIGCKTL